MRNIKFKAVIGHKYCFHGEALTLKQISKLGESFFQDNVEWLQYTGFNDAFGKEIYEGDVVEFVLSGFNIKDKRVIEWGEKGYGAMLEDYHRRIIGNIHINPELLKGKN